MLLVGRFGVPIAGNRILVLDDAGGKRRTSLITPWEFEGGR
jgi:hypothetical protein